MKVKESKVYRWFNNHSIATMIFQIIFVICFFLIGVKVLQLSIPILDNSFSFSYYQKLLIAEINAYITCIIAGLIFGYKHLYTKAIVNFRTIWLTSVLMLLWSAILFGLFWSTSYIQYGRPKKTLTEIMFAILTFVFVGLFEEYFTRGVLLNICLKHLPKNTKGMWISILLSSSLFGLSHALNITSGASIKGIIIQIIYATEIGVFLGAIYLRTHSLLWCSFLHGFYDIACSVEDIFFYNNDIGEVISNFSWYNTLFFIPYVLAGIFILRKGYIITNGIEDNKMTHKIIFVITLSIFVIIFVLCIALFYYVEGLSISEYIQFKKSFHVTY